MKKLFLSLLILLFYCFNTFAETESDLYKKIDIFSEVLDRIDKDYVEEIEQSEVIYSPHGPTYYDRAEGLDFDEDPNQPYVAPDDYVEEDFGAFYTDENTLAPERVLPFNDAGREAGIASLYGQGPQWGDTNRRYEDEYREYTERIGDMVGGPMTYEEFSEAWEDIHQGKPHAGLR